MALTPDQTAVLELLLVRGGQSYADLEDLLGLSQDEVRSRARAALVELGGADPDRNVGLTDYLLGQADPIGRADAVRHLRQDADDHALATRISERLAELAPAAELPKLPPAPGGGSFLSRGPSETATGEPARERRSPLSGIPRERGRLYAALAAAAVIVVAIVLGVSGVFSGDDEPDAGTTTTAEGGGDAAEGIGEIPPGEELSRVALEAPGSGDARGAAIIGLSTGDQPYLDLLIENLDDAPQGDAYVVWFMFDDRRGYPLSPIFPENGSFNDRFAIPTAVLGLIQNTRAIEVAVSNARQTLTEIQKAAQQQTFEIERPGRTVLIGEVPRRQGGNGQGQQGQQG
jgi:hypothetical protein